MWTKNHQRKSKIWFEQKTRPRMNSEWIRKTIKKKIWSKNRKNSKSQSEIAGCEQKIISEKANICSNTVFSLYFKFRAKNFHAAKSLAFSLHFLFRRDQNHYSNLTSKIIKMCEQILKQDHASIQCKFFKAQKSIKSTKTALQQLSAYRLAAVIKQHCGTN